MCLNIRTTLVKFFVILSLLPCGNYCEVLCKNNTAEPKKSDLNIENTEQDIEQDIEQEDMNIKGSYIDSYEKVCDALEIDKLQNSLVETGLGSKLDIKSVIEGLSRGDFSVLGNMFIQGIKDITISELVLNKKILFELISIVLIGQIFVNLSNSFGKSFVSENGFYVTYLIITSIMLVSFSVTLELVGGAIKNVLMLIQIIVPAYALSMNFVGNSMTSFGMYEIIMVGIWLVQFLIIKIVLPMIKLYVIISLINNLNKEDGFSKMCSLIQSFVEWMLKTVVIFIAGLNIVKGLIEPQIDAIGRDTVNRVIQAIPGGGAVSVLTGTFLGAGMIIKNSIGVVGITLILLLILFPVIKTFLIMMVVKITAAMIQPVGEKRYVEGIDSLAKGTAMLLKALLSSAVLFILTIAIMAYLSKG